MIVFISLIAVVALVVVHLLSGKLRFLEGNPRSAWLSIAGGVSVAYVFVHLLPELGEGQEVIAEAVGQDLSFLEKHVYLIALVGLAVFYGLESLAATSRRRKREAIRKDSTSAGVFWLRVMSLNSG